MIAWPIFPVFGAGGPPRLVAFTGPFLGSVLTERSMAKLARKQPDPNSLQTTTPLHRVTLTTDEVHQVYGLTAAFLRRHPEIPRFKCGHRTIVFRVSDIERFLAQCAET